MDVDEDALKELYKDQLASLQQLKRMNRKRFEHQQCHDMSLMVESLSLSIQEQILKVKAVHQRLSTELRSQQRNSDQHLMSLVLQYNTLLQQELLQLRDDYLQTALEAQLMRRQAFALREIQIFAHHVNYETKTKVVINSLDESSSQFKRCAKAVKDNISSNLEKYGYGDVHVHHVLKVDHSVLSAQMQKAAAQVADGKVKGLFCVLPPGGVNAMCVYGLHAQPIPRSSDIFGSSAGKQAMPQDLQPIPATSPHPSNGMCPIDMHLPNLFQISWLWANAEGAPEPGADPSSRAYMDGDPHQAEKLARTSVEAYNRMTKLPLDDPRAKCSYLRFSKSSTASGLDMLSPQDFAEGCYIALCRVLMAQIHTISGPLSDAAVWETAALGCDCLYSTADQEYVLLKPQFVLPEFVMFVEAMQIPNTLARHRHPDDARLHDVPSAWLPFSLDVSSASSVGNGIINVASDLAVESVPPLRSRERSRSAERPHSASQPHVGVLRRRDAGPTETQGLFAPTTADMLISNAAEHIRGRRLNPPQHSHAVRTPRAHLDREIGEEQVPLDASTSNTHIVHSRSQSSEVDRRMAVMQKQSIVLSIQGAKDDFVRHMRDITKDALIPNGSGEQVIRTEGFAVPE